MAGNPLNAFLQGFAVVDQMETNREARADRKQNRSRLNTLWERQDKKYEREELERYRTEKMVEFDAISQDVVERMDADDPGFLDMEAVDGKPAGATRVITEVIRRMIEQDPEFGEHFAKVFGHDPASGPLVRDPTKPVSGIGFIPASLSPNGESGIVYEIDSVNGHQGLTRYRTSADNDPLIYDQMGRGELVKLFGQQAMTSNLLAVAQLREMLGFNEVSGKAFQGEPGEKRPESISVDEQGNDIPISHRGQLQADGTRIRSGEGTLDDGTVIHPDGTITDPNAQGRQQTELDRLAAAGVRVGPRGAIVPGTTSSVAEATQAPPEEELEFIRSSSQPSDSDIVKFTGQRNADQLADVIRKREETATREIIEEFDQNDSTRATDKVLQPGVDAVNAIIANTNTAKRLAEANKRFEDFEAADENFATKNPREYGENSALALGSLVDVTIALGTGVTQDAIEAGKWMANGPIGEFLSGLFGSTGEFIGGLFSTEISPKVTTDAAHSVKDMSAAGADPKGYRASEIVKSDKVANKAITDAPIPAGKAAIEATTTAVTQSRSARPSFVQTMNAASLAKIGVITREQFINFADTGKLNGALKPAYHFVTDDSGVTSVFTNGQLTNRVRTGPGKDGDGSLSEKETFKFRTELLEDFFTDEDGKLDRRGARNAVRQFGRTENVFSRAFFDDKPIPTTQDFADDFEDGIRFQNRYSDPRSALNPTRWFDSRELGRQSGTLGFIAVKTGITSQDDFNNFALEFGIEFGEFANNQRWSEERLVKQQISMEETARDFVKDGTFPNMEVAREEVREGTVTKIKAEAAARRQGNN